MNLTLACKCPAAGRDRCLQLQHRLRLMPYTTVPAAPFSGGLNLRDSYEVMQPSQAYDLLNVTFDERGGVRQRPGFSEFATCSVILAPLT